MKLNKKKVFVTALVISVAAIISMGTLAWFTDTDAVDNHFKVSTDDQTQKPDFSITLFETEVDPATNQKGDANGNGVIDKVKTNTYDNIVPGDVLPKDPTVRNDGQYDQWVRVKVTLNDYDKWQAVLGTDFDFRTLFSVSTAWSFDTITTDNAAKTLTLVYYLDSKLTVGDTSAALFDTVTIPSEFTVDNMPTDFSLKIVAEALQADNTGSNAKSAFANYWD